MTTRLGTPLAAGLLLLWVMPFAACGDEVAVTSPDSQPAAAELPLESEPAAAELPLDTFFSLIHPDEPARNLARRKIFEDWKPSYTALVLEIARFSAEREELLARVEEKSGQQFAGDFQAALRWLWNQEIPPHSDYRRFKRQLYGQIDPRFAAYFGADAPEPEIRLDEIQWGGVLRDGIPPLKNPTHIRAAEASYLSDSDIVFGVLLNGDARAYPKRILAWHEMVKDVVGEVSINAVYCTLCGTVVVYRTEQRGTHHELGTSGFLYRSNKLMYDHASESLWSTFGGKPVVGPLVGQDIALTPSSVVTTTWGRWKKLHPQSRVLSLETGHDRDYREGAAYREYFATDELMFAVPHFDTRLANKAEVLALRFGSPDAAPLAIDSAFLQKQPVYRGTHAGLDYVVLTDSSGAHRVYADAEIPFVRYDGDVALFDRDGTRWEVQEQQLLSPGGESRKRLAAHRAFWFGWHAAHPETQLIRDG